MDLRISWSMLVSSYHLSSIQARVFFHTRSSAFCNSCLRLQSFRFKPRVFFYTREFHILQLLNSCNS